MFKIGKRRVQESLEDILGTFTTAIDRLEGLMASNTKEVMDNSKIIEMYTDANDLLLQENTKADAVLENLKKLIVK